MKTDITAKSRNHSIVHIIEPFCHLRNLTTTRTFSLISDTVLLLCSLSQCESDLLLPSKKPFNLLRISASGWLKSIFRFCFGQNIRMEFSDTTAPSAGRRSIRSWPRRYSDIFHEDMCLPNRVKSLLTALRMDPPWFVRMHLSGVDMNWKGKRSISVVNRNITC